MKKKYCLFVFLCFALVFCAYKSVPHLHFEINGSDVDVVFNGANINNDQLELRVGIKSEDSSYEILRDIEVSTSPNFDTTLKLNSCNPNGNSWLYKFSIPKNELTETVYIRQPIILAPYYDLCKSKLQLGSVGTDLEKELYDIKSIDAIEVDNSKHVYGIKICYNAFANVIPSCPKLLFENNEYGAVSSQRFDESLKLSNGEIVFYINAQSIEEILKIIDDSEIVISSFYKPVDIDDLFFETSTNAMSLKVLGE